MAKWRTNLKDAVKAWLLGLTLSVNGRTVRNVYYGDFDAPKDRAKMPLIEFEFLDNASDQLSPATQNRNVQLQINVWNTGKRNPTNVDAAQDAVESIFASFMTASFLSTYGIITMSITTDIDPEPLFDANAVGAAGTIRFDASGLNART